LHRVGVYRSSVLVDIVNYAGIPLLVLYSFSMFAYPWIEGSWSWPHVQAVWDRWQTLNAGALAFLASLVAFNVSRYNDNLQRERDFVSAKAFLPSTLSSLMEYFSRCAEIYESLWGTDGHASTPIKYPNLPSDYKEVFSNCIRYADPDVGTYLSDILVQLQIHEARLHDVVAQSDAAPAHVVDRYTLLAYLYRLGELYALVGKLFGFARGEEKFEVKPLVWEDFRNAYGILDLDIGDMHIDEKMNLRAFTERAIERENGQGNTSRNDA